MSRRGCLTLAAFLFSSTLLASDTGPDAALWREYGLVQSTTTQQGNLNITEYKMKDATGALAAWEWIRTPGAHACDVAVLCSQERDRTVLSDYNWVLLFTGGHPTKAQVAGIFQSLPNKRNSSLPPVLTFLPVDGLVPNSARYVLGPASLAAFAPELASANAGLDRGGEGQVAEYRLSKGAHPLRLALFYYASPGMARTYAAEFRKAGVPVKRSGLLVGIALPPVDSQQADTLLSRVQYNARITENANPPGNPIKPLYLLLRNIIYLSIVLSCLCIFAGLIYAGMRIYRRRYGTLESDEAMTTLRLTE